MNVAGRAAPITPHAVGGALAAARVAVGVSALVAPGPLLRLWVGPELSQTRPARVIGRALAGRDAALGALALYASLGGRSTAARIAVGAGAAADGVDLLATLIAWPTLPRRSRYLVLAVTGGAVVAGAWAAAT